MSQILETIAVIVGTIMAVGGLGMSAAISSGGDDNPAGCLVALIGLALVVLGLGFYSHWSLHFLMS
jgi:hypothetical protein